MSKYYRKMTGQEGNPTTNQEMRILMQQPGRVDENGNPQYVTEQNHKKECDVNEIIKKYDKTGLITHTKQVEGKFGDMTGIEFQIMQNKVANAKSMFEQFPVHIKKRFDQSVHKLLEFMESPENRDEAIELGLISAESLPEKDGLGEHVPLEENEDKKE